MESIDEVSLTAILQGNVNGFSDFAQRCSQFYIGETINKELPRIWTPWGSIRGRCESFESYVLNVPDVELREMLLILIQELRKLDDLNERWAEAFVQFFEMPMPENYQEWEKFRRKIDRYRKANGPGWLAVPVCRQLAAQTQQVVAAIAQFKPHIDQKLSQLYGHILITDEEFGDQRAKDLIDEAEGELDHHKAINMLKRALRYGQTGIQASKAYMYLGMRYEDLGDADQAIAHYSQALAAWEPFALLYFWRGQLYYQRGQWPEAKDDLEKAVAGDLSSPEDEQAREYLADIDKRLQA